MKKIMALLATAAVATAMIFTSCNQEITGDWKTSSKIVDVTTGELDLAAGTWDNSWAAGWGDKEYYGKYDEKNSVLVIAAKGGWAVKGTFKCASGAAKDLSALKKMTVKCYTDEDDTWDNASHFKVEFYTDDTHMSEAVVDYDENFIKDVDSVKAKKPNTYTFDLSKLGDGYNMAGPADMSDIAYIKFNPQGSSGTLYISSVTFE